MQALLDVILPVFLVIGFGYGAAWKGWFSDSAVDGVTKFAQNYAIPCLLFQAMSRIDLSETFDLPLLFSFYIGNTSGFFLGLLGARFIFKRDWPAAVAIGFCCLFSNSVLLGLPITERAYGPDALVGNYAIITFHAPFCYIVGITAMEIVRSTGKGVFGSLTGIGLSMSRNPLVIGIALGILVNLLNLPVPGVLDDAVGLMARAGLPAALFALGGGLVRYRPEGDMKTILMICTISLIVHPAISYSVGRGVGLDIDGLRSVVMNAAMAPGMNTFIFASIYGVALRVAASALLIATACSVLTIWVWLLILP